MNADDTRKKKGLLGSIWGGPLPETAIVAPQERLVVVQKIQPLKPNIVETKK